MKTNFDLELNDDTVLQALDWRKVENPILACFDVLETKIAEYLKKLPDMKEGTMGERQEYVQQNFGFFSQQIDRISKDYQLSPLDIISIYSRTIDSGLDNPEFSDLFRSAVLKFASRNLSDVWEGIAYKVFSEFMIPEEARKNEQEHQLFNEKVEEISQKGIKALREYNPETLPDKERNIIKNLQHSILQIPFKDICY